jgi:hypothetical protein
LQRFVPRLRSAAAESGGIYLNFGAVLAMVVVLFAINLAAVPPIEIFDERKLMCFDLFWLR